jgi:hypothetical protein
MLKEMPAIPSAMENILTTSTDRSSNPEYSFDQMFEILNDWFDNH